MVASVAALHRMEAASALAKMGDLLRPGRAAGGRPPPLTYREMRGQARALPGARFRRHLYLRYSLL